MTEVLAPLAGWESFYVIAGSSAAALTGLQFVVMALIADVRPHDSSDDTINAFGTPTVVHFCLALLVSAALSAPWTRWTPVAVLLGLTGIGGMGYAAIVVRRTRRQRGYRPVWEDWLWHAVLPLLSYGTLTGAGATLPSDPADALFAVAGAVLLLVFVGIHNAWDSVAYITVAYAGKQRAAAEAPRAPAPTAAKDVGAIAAPDDVVRTPPAGVPAGPERTTT